MHDATKQQLGVTQSSSKYGSEDFNSSPATFKAGLAVRRKSDNTLSVAVADGEWVGVSLGQSLSNDGWTCVLRAGERVPLLLKAGFTPAIGAAVYISRVTGMGLASGDGEGVDLANAIYVSGVLTGLQEDGTTANVAIIDMPGGL